MNETTKSYEYRKKLGYDKFFKGTGIDLGAGDWPLSSEMSADIESILPYDYIVADTKGYEDIREPDVEKKQLRGLFGDAHTCYNLADNQFDFVYSSHLLEHIEDPYAGFNNWIRICKPGGFIFTSVPHEIFYEKCVWPTQFSVWPSPHVTSWTIEWKSNLPNSIHIPEFVKLFENEQLITPILAKTALHNFDFNEFSKDQTSWRSGFGNAICQIDFVVQKNQ